MNLTSLTPGQSLLGLTPSGPATILAVQLHSNQAATVTFRTAAGQLQERVIYQHEATQLKPHHGTTRPFDAPASDFKLAAEAQRITLAGLTDPMLAIATSNVRPLPHQIQAVYGELLQRIPLRFLLADDPGAGKTIMAGLYIKELILRDDVHRCLIVAPGGLVDQWQDELKLKFGLAFEILDPAAILNHPSATPFENHPLLIARMDQLARNPDLLHHLQTSHWDLTIVDEAHRMSARFFGTKLQRTQRFQLGQLLGRISRHLLLMTATPHAGKEEDFQLFLTLLDRDLFEGRYKEGMAADPKRVMRRMVKEELLTMEGTALFPERIAETIPYTLIPAEQDLYEDVTEYVRQGMNRADRLEGKRKNTVGFALTVLQRRLASSPEAIFQSLRRRAARLGTRLQEMRSGTFREWVEPSTLDFDDEFVSEEQEFLEEELVDAASAARTAEELEFEIRELEELVRKAAAVRASGEDRKWTELRSILHSEVLGASREGTPRKIIVFTEHKDTLDYLRNNIGTLLGGHAVEAIHGGVPRPERRRITEEFTKNPAVQVLIATDAAGEGLNLQAAHLMVNYDLPWNPNRIEQRFGRIHRIGQTEVCRLWNLVATTTREGQVFDRLLSKIEQQRLAYGGKVFDVLGGAFEGESLRDLLMQAIRYGDLPETRAYLERVINEDVGSSIQRLISEHSMAAEVMAKEDVAAIRRQMDEARARRLQPHYIETAFRSAFTRLGGRIARREKGRYEIANVPAAIRGRNAPIATRYERVTFELDRVKPDGLAEADLLAPGHPLHDSVMQLAVKTWGESLEHGTVLVSADLTEPALLVGVEEEVVDGTGESIAKRFGYAFLLRSGEIQPAGPAPYLDCVAAPNGASYAHAHSEWLTGGEQKISNWMISHDLPEFLQQTTAKRKAELNRDRELVTVRLEHVINDLYVEAAAAAAAVAEGKSVRESADSLTRKAEDLEQRMKDRLALIASQLHMTTKPPRVIMSALVLPYTEAAGEIPLEDPIHKVNTAEVDARAVAAVMAAERALGRIPEEQVHHNKGYDILSTGELPDGDARHVYIEVKGRIEGGQVVMVSHSQVNTGKNMGEDFRLAIVSVSPEGPAHDQVRYLANPFDGVSFGTLDAAHIGLELDKTWAKAREPF